MSRPRCRRTVWDEPEYALFKPIGVPMTRLDEVVMTTDEFEAIRLADLEGLYHDEAAQLMKVSRQTFGRIIESARKKTARTLIEGKALRIEGGDVQMAEERKFRCDDCSHAWELPHGTGRPGRCPQCSGANIHRSEDQRGAFGAGPGCRGAKCRRGFLKK